MTVLTDPLGWFTLEVAEGWRHETEDGVTTVRGPLGAGALYLCGGRHARGRQASFGRADFLTAFLRWLGVVIEDGAIERAPGAGCSIYSYRRQSDGVHWQYWSVTDDETVLLLSYVCAAADAGREKTDVDAMVHSVRLFHSAPVQ